MKRLPITFYHTWLPLSAEERYRDMCEFAAGGGNNKIRFFHGSPAEKTPSANTA